MGKPGDCVAAQGTGCKARASLVSHDWIFASRFHNAPSLEIKHLSPDQFAPFQTWWICNDPAPRNVASRHPNLCTLQPKPPSDTLVVLYRKPKNTTHKIALSASGSLLRNHWWVASTCFNSIDTYYSYSYSRYQ